MSDSQFFFQKFTDSSSTNDTSLNLSASAINTSITIDSSQSISKHSSNDNLQSSPGLRGSINLSTSTCSSTTAKPNAGGGVDRTSKNVSPCGSLRHSSATCGGDSTIDLPADTFNESTNTINIGNYDVVNCLTFWNFKISIRFKYK